MGVVCDLLRYFYCLFRDYGLDDRMNSCFLCGYDLSLLAHRVAVVLYYLEILTRVDIRHDDFFLEVRLLAALLIPVSVGAKT